MILRSPTGTGSIHIFIKLALCPDLLPFGKAGMGRTEVGSSQALVLSFCTTIWFGLRISFLGFRTGRFFNNSFVNSESSSALNFYLFRPLSRFTSHVSRYIISFSMLQYSIAHKALLRSKISWQSLLHDNPASGNDDARDS